MSEPMSEPMSKPASNPTSKPKPEPKPNPDSNPTSKSKKPAIHLYTAATTNGWKPLIFLEEAEIEYDLTAIDLGQGEQKTAWYRKLNPNARIPTLVDRDNDDFVIFESGAMLWYLAEKYHRFLPRDAKGRSQALQWLMFQMGGVGPMMGQAMYFQRIAAPQGHVDAFAIDRYIKESRRLLEVIDRQLAGKDYILGDTYSIADMAIYPYARCYPWANVSVDGLDHLNAWFDRLDPRPAIRRAVALPNPFPEALGKGDMQRATAANAARFPIRSTPKKP